MANTNLLLDQPPISSKVIGTDGKLDPNWQRWFMNFHSSFNQFFPVYSPATSNSSASLLGAPKLTTAQRDALQNVADSTIIYNTTTNAFNFRENGAWVTK